MVMTLPLQHVETGSIDVEVMWSLPKRSWTVRPEKKDDWGAWLRMNDFVEWGPKREQRLAAHRMMNGRWDGMGRDETG